MRKTLLGVMRRDDICLKDGCQSWSSSCDMLQECTEAWLNTVFPS